jgi:tripartite-type tricarboxylate transporter receptor subunit TctC
MKWLGLILAVSAAAASAQQYPLRPVRIIAAFAPGNAGDIIPRAMLGNLGDALKQNFIIDNRPGAGGNIAAELAAKATPDGHTLFFTTAGIMAINPSLYSKLPFDPVRDFAPISLAATSPNVLVLNLTVPAGSVKELIALAKAKPGELNFGSSGSGTTVHLSGELFASMAGVKMVHVPYKGAGESLTDLMAGRLQLIFASLSSATQLIRSGKLKALAVTGPQRHPSMPNLPTVAESGLPGYEATVWFGLVAPAATPKAIITRLNTVLVDILATKEVKDRLFNVGVDAVSSTPEEFAGLIQEELVKWARVVKASGAKAD